MKKSSGSLYLGTVTGTSIYLHWSFLVLLMLVFFSSWREAGHWMQGLVSLLFLLSVFACVTLHEFGHILVGRRFGCNARTVTLYPIGGIARLERIPEKPYQEFWMALAGPWVNVVIAAGIFLYLSLTQDTPRFTGIEELTAKTFLYNLMVVNITLAVFNLIPAFPTDGGRILRSLLAARMDRVKATRIAARIGQVIAVLFIIAGLFVNWWLIVIGVFIIIAASGEAMLEISKSVMAKHTVREIVMQKFTLLKADDTIESVMQVILDSHEKSFVVDAGDNQYGTVTGDDIVLALRDPQNRTTVGSIMKRNIRVLEPGMSLEDVFMRMSTNEEVICPVVENGTLIGVLDLNNINEFIVFRMAVAEQGR